MVGNMRIGFGYPLNDKQLKIIHRLQSSLSNRSFEHDIYLQIPKDGDADFLISVNQEHKIISKIGEEFGINTITNRVYEIRLNSNMKD